MLAMHDQKKQLQWYNPVQFTLQIQWKCYIWLQTIMYLLLQISSQWRKQSNTEKVKCLSKQAILVMQQWTCKDWITIYL